MCLKLPKVTTKLYICLFNCYVMMETKDVHCGNRKAKLIWYQFFSAPPVAQDQRSYSICVLSHEVWFTFLLAETPLQPVSLKNWPITFQSTVKVCWTSIYIGKNESFLAYFMRILSLL